MKIAKKKKRPKNPAEIANDRYIGEGRWFNPNTFMRTYRAIKKCMDEENAKIQAKAKK